MVDSRFQLRKGGLAVASATLALVTLGGMMVGVTASGASRMTTKTGLAYARTQIAKYSGQAELPTVLPVKHIAASRERRSGMYRSRTPPTRWLAWVPPWPKR